jgi:hypothetical protein
MHAHRSALFSLACVTALHAQCDTPWLPGIGLAGANNSVSAAVLWDPDGAGPQPLQLVVGGKFTWIGAIPATAVATYNPGNGTWGSLGTLSGTLFNELRVRATAVAANGDLIVGGNFLYADGQPVANLARWTGTTWAALGSGIGGYVESIACRPNGDIVVAGNIVIAGGTAANGIAIWNGTTWAAMGSGPNDIINQLATLPNGDVVAVGAFTSISGIAANRVARWDGAAWNPLGTGLDEVSYAVGVDAAGAVVASGNFTHAGGVPAALIARWDGSTWAPLGSGLTNPARTITHGANGDLLVGGWFTQAGGVPALRVARWNGSQWSAFGNGIGSLAYEDFRVALELPGGDIVAGGDFTTSSGILTRRLARWNGSSWLPLSDESEGAIRAITTLANGDLVVAGSFTNLDGVPCNRIARRTGNTWTNVGSGLDGTVNALLVMPNGDLVAGGAFPSAGTVAASHVARWNGSQWSAPAGVVGGEVTAMCVLANGELVISGSFSGNLKRLTGSGWQAFPSAPITLAASSLVSLPNGGLAAASNGGVVRWDGTTWITTPPVNATKLAISPAGELLAAGNTVYRLTGNSWLPLGGNLGLVATALIALPDGDVQVATGFTFSLPSIITASLHRWNGTAWSSSSSPYGQVLAFANTPNGDLVLGGSFTIANNQSVVALTRRTTTCPAGSMGFGAGCAGSLVTTNLPWIGGAFRSEAAGMPTSSVAVGVLGLASTSVPLSSILPIAAPGCTLLVSPDLLSVAVPVNGTATLTVPLPDSLALVGATLHQQVLALTFDLTGSLLTATATNGLSFTIGAL